MGAHKLKSGQGDKPTLELVKAEKRSSELDQLMEEFGNEGFHCVEGEHTQDQSMFPTVSTETQPQATHPEFNKVDEVTWVNETAEAHLNIYEVICRQSRLKQWVLSGVKSLLEQPVQLGEGYSCQVRQIHAAITNTVSGMNWLERLILGRLYLHLQTKTGIQRDSIKENKLVA